MWDAIAAGSVYAVAFSPADTGLVATGGGDDLGFIWRVGDAESHKELRGNWVGSIVSLHRMYKLNLFGF